MVIATNISLNRMVVRVGRTEKILRVEAYQLEEDVEMWILDVHVRRPH
jgi:hypothetical protein